MKFAAAKSLLIAAVLATALYGGKALAMPTNTPSQVIMCCFVDEDCGAFEVCGFSDICGSYYPDFPGQCKSMFSPT